MAPVRRYLRITRHSVLEVRIFADRPQDVDTWLLRRGDPALPRIIAAIKPLVLPKLREESERAKRKRKADKKGLKDSVVQDDFEVAIFLTQGSARHSLLTKRKEFGAGEGGTKKDGKLIGWLTGGGVAEEPVVVRDEEDGDEVVDLSAVPDAPVEGMKRGRTTTSNRPVDVEDDLEEDSDQDDSGPAAKRARLGQDDAEGDSDDKKKLSFNTSYDGFAIYGRILCLVVKRRGVKTQAATSQQMLESWVSTQVAQDAGIDDERDDG